MCPVCNRVHPSDRGRRTGGSQRTETRHLMSSDSRGPPGDHTLWCHRNKNPRDTPGILFILPFGGPGIWKTPCSCLVAQSHIFRRG